jgi:hypothetical protein
MSLSKELYSSSAKTFNSMRLLVLGIRVKEVNWPVSRLEKRLGESMKELP